jgi:iron(III) transport system permease protein
MAVAFLWVAVATAGEMTVTDLFLVRTYAEEIYTQFALGDTLGGTTWHLFPSVLATAWVLLAGLLLVARLIPGDRFASQRAPRVFDLGRWRIAAGGIAVVAVGLLTLVPAASLAVKAGRTVTRVEAGFERGWSAEQFLSMTLASPLRFGREFGWTLAIGALAATTAVAVALPLAWNARRRGWRALGAWIAAAACLAIPGPLVGLGLIRLFNAFDWAWLAWLYDRSIAPIWMAQSIRALPLATLVLWYALRTIPTELLASATLEGASPLARFVRIVLPQRMPAVGVAWLVAFAIAAGELDASILVIPPGIITLPIQVFGLIHYGVDDQVAGVSLFIMALIVLLAAVVALVGKRATRND